MNEIMNDTLANVVFRWELTELDFVEVIRQDCPEIENPVEFFRRHQDEIVHRFQKGFAVLISELGDYDAVMREAIRLAVQEGEANHGE